MRRQRWIDGWVACGCWLALAYSVGWYGTLTRMGHKHWPLPSPETAAAHMAAFGAWAGFEPDYYPVWWFVLFVVCGWMWVALLTLTSPYFDGRNVQIANAARPFALASLPLAGMGPVVAYYVYQRRGEFLFDTIYLKAVEFGLVEPEPWLGPGYLGLAALCLVLQFFVHNHVYAVPPKFAVLHFAMNAAITAAAAIGLATLARMIAEAGF